MLYFSPLLKMGEIAFQPILKPSSVLDAEVLFVDDRDANVDAARSLDIHAERFGIYDCPDVFVNMLDANGIHADQQIMQTPFPN